MKTTKQHREELLQKKRDYYQRTKEERKEHRRRYYQENRERILHSPRNREVRNRLRANLKREVILHYGNGEIVCSRCGFKDIKALSIDHINGGGNKHRRKIKNFYYWLRKNNFPEGYQVLCMNCQFIKKIEEDEHRWNGIQL